MDVDLEPRIEKIVSLSSNVTNQLKRNGHINDASAVFGKLCNGDRLTWLVDGSTLIVVHTSNGSIYAVYNFIRDTPQDGQITHVKEFIDDPLRWKLLVVTSNGQKGSFLHIFNIRQSKVDKTIFIPETVTSLEVISCTSGNNCNNILNDQSLRLFQGMVALGTEGGNVLLLDLGMDCDLDLETNGNNGNLLHSAIKISYFNGKKNELPLIRENKIAENKLVAYLLNGSVSKNTFRYCNSENEIIFDSAKVDIYVSSMLYVQQMGCLFVGYNFGGFQIYDITKLSLVYSCDPDDFNDLPVVQFTFQEPENDPKIYCYVWIVRGYTDNSSCNQFSHASMYSILFSNKTVIKSVGTCYLGMRECVKRFVFPLHGYVKSINVDNWNSSRLISCISIDSRTFRKELSSRESISDSFINASGSICCCVFVWEAYTHDLNKMSKITLGIFDLNQWYQAQMPSTLKLSNMELCSYFGFFSLDALNDISPMNLLDVYLPVESITRPAFFNRMDSLFFPSALAFDVVVLTDSTIIRGSYLGLHRQVLQKVCANASTLLVDPRQTIDLCLYCSLISQSPNILFSQMNLSSKREAIFSMALECNAMGILMSCINEWAPGRYASDGCTLRFIQDWAWKKVLKIKSYLDKQCTILYDCSGLQIDELICQSIRQNVVMLKNLEVVYKSLGKQTQIIPTTNLGAKELEHRTSVISLLILHYDSVLWFINTRLLPELSDIDESSFIGFAYPKSFLINSYTIRRGEIQRINSSLKPTDLLIIDGIIEESGESIINLWKTQPGNCCYPPNSINALLNIYLLPELCLSVKHTIVQYFLLDINELLQNSSNAHLCEPLTEYSSTFACNHSVILLTRGFWLLDHKDFDGAMNVLLHPMVNPTDIRPWQSRRIMKALLYQGEPGKALRYSHVYQPCKETSEDVQFYLTLLLANGLIPDAFAYLRSVRDMTNCEELIQHFFLGCQQTKNLRGMLQLLYNPMEEQSLIKFMSQNSDSKIRELLVIYHLQRFHFVEAVQVNNQLNSDVMHANDPSAKERAVTRNAIIEGYSKVYPNIQMELAKLTRTTLSHRKTFWEKGKKVPAPLSTIVVTNPREPISKSSILEAVMDKITELWTQTSPRRNSVNETDHNLSKCFLPQTPFTPRRTISKESQQAIIHPTIQKKESIDLHFGESFLTSSPVKSKFLDTSPFYLSESSKRRSNTKLFNSELLSILQPVPVKRKLPSMNSVCSSPASILKQRTTTSKYKELASFDGKEQDLKLSTLSVMEEQDSLDNLISKSLPQQSINIEEIRTSKIRFSSQRNIVSLPSSSASSPLIGDTSTESCTPSPRRPLHCLDKFSSSENNNSNEIPNSPGNNSNSVVNENDRISSTEDEESASSSSDSQDQSIYQTPEKMESSFESHETPNSSLHLAKHKSYFSATGFRERLSWIKTELAKEEVKDSDEITITSNLSTDKTEIKIMDKPVRKSLVEQTVDQCFADQTDDSELMKKFQSRKQHPSSIEENSEVDIEALDDTESVESSLAIVEKNQEVLLPELPLLPLPTGELSVTVEFPGITKASLRSYSPKSSPSSMSHGSKSDKDSICVDKMSDLTDSVPANSEAITEDDIIVELPLYEDSEPQTPLRKTALYSSVSSRKARKRNTNKNMKTYAFSPPTVVEPEISSASLTASALSSPTSAAFLFSTPLTRSRLKKARKSITATVRASEEDCGKSDSSDVPSETTPQIRTRRLSKSSDGTPSSSDTLINFTSPALEMVPEESESRLANVRHSMTLRRSKMKTKRLAKFR